MLYKKLHDFCSFLSFLISSENVIKWYNDTILSSSALDLERK